MSKMRPAIFCEAYKFKRTIMHTHTKTGEIKKGTNQKVVIKDDLVELVLGPLSDQIDRARSEILSAIQKVNESADIIAREVKRQSEPEN